ncbi:hypothetical protein [Burkholderia territorii]|uniref:hypothetical protein n=1 Tax=Burkholderia territorii TaxID=1503055 RepID=UPI0012D984FD|nr:hypothetical protein [Burkholderia territorii]
MKTSKFTEEQIAFALKQAELGTKVEERVSRTSRVASADGLRPALSIDLPVGL